MANEQSGAVHMQSTPRRPALRWYGGKWMLAPWIIAHFPKHQVYVEPFCGAASVLLRKPPCYAEVINDLDQSVVNLFRVLRSDRADELITALNLTPFARDEFVSAYDDTDCPVERARRLIIRSFMGFGSNAHHRATGFRANSNRSGTTPAHDWSNYPDALRAIVERIKPLDGSSDGVTVENRDAKACMAQHDAPTTLHYVDPPYVLDTRSDTRTDYDHELSDDDHAELLTFLRGLRGMVVLSGYPSDQYDAALADWRRVERVAFADGARKRTEVLWINPAASAAGRSSPTLFEVA